MNIEDAEIVNAERDADPQRFRDYDPNDTFPAEYEKIEQAFTHRNEQGRSRTQNGAAGEATEEAERASVSSSSTASSVGGRERNNRDHRPSMASRVSTTASTGFEAEVMHYLDRHPTAVKRIQDHRLQHSQTVGSTKQSRVSTGDGTPLPSFGGGKPYPPPLPDREEYVVEFDSHEDLRHAQNWPLRKKVLISAILIFDSLAATFASSIISAATNAIGEEFHKGREVVTLATSLFVLGYALGPIVFAPMSELYGRRLPIILAAFAFGIFNIAVAVAKDYQTIMICRFFGGIFGSAPLTICAAVFADMFSNKYRGLAVALFSGSVFNGPLMAPFIGGFITKSYLGWRWTAYIPAFMGFAGGIAALIWQEESYGPVILVSKAAELRRRTRNWGIHAKQEEVEVDLKELAQKNLMRPLKILFTEPIVLIVTIYMSFLYGILYLNLTAYSIIFGEIHGFSLGVSGLPYFGLIIGVFIGIGVVSIDVPRYGNKLEKNHNIPVPEWRVPIMAAGGISFSIGLFWLGWTGYTKSIPWIVPTLAGLPLGFGIYCVFLQCLNYIIDAYLMFAASAIAANTFLRSLFGAIFPLFATYMFDGIGIQWGMTFLGCMSLLFIPMPFIFLAKGKSIRAKSKFAPALDISEEERRDLESGGGGGITSIFKKSKKHEESNGESNGSADTKESKEA